MKFDDEHKYSTSYRIATGEFHTITLTPSGKHPGCLFFERMCINEKKPDEGFRDGLNKPVVADALPIILGAMGVPQTAQWEVTPFG